LQVGEVDPVLLCPPPEQEQTRELVLQLVCVLLALVNVLVFSKLLYDYWQYRHKGKVPRIVHLIPFL